MKLGVQIGILNPEWGDDWPRERPQPCEEAIAQAAATGAHGLEVFERHIVAYYDRPERLENALAGAGIELAGVYFPMETALKPEAAAGIPDTAEKACRFMQEAGCRHLILNGGPRYGDAPAFAEDDFEKLAETMNNIGDIGRSHGVTVVFHPHYHCTIETSDHVDLLIKAGLDKRRVGLCVHASHQLQAGADPYEMYEKHASWVRYVHIGNTTITDGKPVGCLLGEGKLDQKRLMKPLLQAGFDGWVVIECRKQGAAPAEYTQNARDYLGKSFPEIEWV